jgi:DNA mismatch endonuclease (patch repair protein)
MAPERQLISLTAEHRCAQAIQEKCRNTWNPNMADTRTAEQRHRIMKSVRTQHTGPERIVRRVLSALGYRYRLHSAVLPGRPDIVFRARRKAIFVHGCFWHGHACLKGKPPKSRQEYWEPKLSANCERDRRNISELETAGWRVHVVWQCEAKDLAALEEGLRAFLGPRKVDRLPSKNRVASRN